METSQLRAAGLSLLVLYAAGCGGGSSVATVKPTPAATCVPASTPEFAYILTGYAVSMFTVDSCTGAFTSTAPATAATGYAYPQDDAEQMVVDPAGRFAYVANLVSNASDEATVSMYTIDPSTGVLTATTPATVATGFLPQGIAIDPSGKFVYTANSDDNTVSMFTIDQTTGVLTPTTPATVSTGTEASPGFVTVDPTGKFAYVANQDVNTISMFTINSSTGVLTPTTPATVASGMSPFGVAVAPSGKFAYVPDAYDARGGLVSQYGVDSVTGVLTPNTPAYVLAGNSPVAVAVDPSSKYAYVVNRNDNTVSMFTIDSTTGNLTLNTTISAPTGIIATGTEPYRINFDPSGKFVYVTNEQSATSIYTVNSDGTLTAMGNTGEVSGGLSTAITAAK
jgi:6-phosphogluconolactonase (cycloisomerase 2 family)